MVDDGGNGAVDRLREITSSLRKPVHDLPALAGLLSAPLALFGVLPPKLKKNDTQPIDDTFTSACIRHIPTLQDAILHYVVPTWHKVLLDEGLEDLIDLYFSPGNDGRGDIIALYAYTTVLSALPTSPAFASSILPRLVEQHPLHTIHATSFRGSLDISESQRESLWNDYLQAAFSIPGKVANALGKDVPGPLTHEEYLSSLLRSTETLLYELSMLSQKGRDKNLESLTSLFVKLVNTGFFPPTQPISPAQPSFFSVNLRTIKRRFSHLNDGPAYSQMLGSIFRSLPSTAGQKVLGSLLGAMNLTGGLETPSRRVAQEAKLLHSIIGAVNDETWDIVTGVFLGKPWSEEVARVLVHWVASSEEPGVSELTKRTLEVWTSPQHIKYSMLSMHRYITTILLLSIAHLPTTSQTLSKLSISSPFLESIGTYIGHTDASIRRCGMLVAEVVAQRLGKKLDFGDWDEEGGGREWCRRLRTLVETKDDFDAAPDSDDEDEEQEVAEEPEPPPTGKKPQSTLYDSDDSLTGYASPSSSRSPSPTPSDLDEIEKDPSLAVGKRKISRPVYLLQLAELLAPGKGNDQTEPDRMEMALNEGAELIRRKKGYGLELEENAVNLACAYIRVQDNFDLDGFFEKRSAALIALVAGCPEKAAPCLIEQFFTGQYSADVRGVILDALVVGARELAGFAPPPPDQRHFASKLLPPALHRKYVSSSDTSPTSSLPQIMEGISREVIDKTRDATEDKVPQVVREKQLRVRSKQIKEVRSAGTPTRSTFNDVAAEYFIMPMINRFWTHLRDEQTREVRSRYTTSAYKGTGTGMILNAATLGSFLLALAILLHASRNSLAFLAVLAPESIELAVTMGTRTVSSPTDSEEPTAKATVLAGAMELTLIALDLSVELDSGRTLGLDHTRLLLAVNEWAEKVFGALEEGANVDEGGGEGEARIRRASAGVLLAIESVLGKWGAAMIRL